MLAFQQYGYVGNNFQFITSSKISYTPIRGVTNIPTDIAVKFIRAHSQVMAVAFLVILLVVTLVPKPFKAQ